MATVLGANSVTGGYEVENSLRFSRASSTGLQLDLGTPTNAKKYTISFWIKREVSGISGEIIAGGADASNETFIRMNGNGLFQFKADHGSATGWQTTPNALGRDPSAWYHYIAAVDTSQSTASNRVKIYLNGVLQSLGTANYPDQDDAVGFLNNDNVIHIGTRNYDDDIFFDGYLCEFVFLDGQTLDPTSFGEFDSDSGIWRPIDVSGLTYGDNGFYLEFKQVGTSQNSSGMGADTSGNDNHFAVENLTAVNQSIDTCTNNFATLNPLQPPVHSASNAMVLREGNLQLHGSTDGGPKFEGGSTIGVSSGKWYAEFKSTISNNVFGMVGVDSNPGELARNDKYPGYYANSYGYFKDGEKYTGNSGSSYGDAWTNDIIGIALDLDNNKLYFSKNGTFQNSGDPTTGATGTGAISITAASSTTAGAYFFVLGDTSTSYINPFDCNFGSPMHSISSSNADGDGFGNFEYAVPSGYFALCTKNLAETG